MTIADTVLLQFEATLQPGYEMQMPKVDKLGELRHRRLEQPRQEARRQEQRGDDLPVSAGAVPVGQVRHPGLHVPVPRCERSQRHARACQRADRRGGHVPAGRSAGQSGDRGHRGRGRDAQGGHRAGGFGRWLCWASRRSRRRGFSCAAGGRRNWCESSGRPTNWPMPACGPWWRRISSNRARSRNSTSGSAASCGTTSRTGSTCTPRSARRRNSWRSCGSPPWRGRPALACRGHPFASLRAGSARGSRARCPRHEEQGQDALATADKQVLEEFLTHCDLVKFAKHDPTTDQVQRTFDLVKDFIERTKSEERKVDVTDKMEAAETTPRGGGVDGLVFALGIAAVARASLAGILHAAPQARGGGEVPQPGGHEAVARSPGGCGCGRCSLPCGCCAWPC